MPASCARGRSIEFLLQTLPISERKTLAANTLYRYRGDNTIAAETGIKGRYIYIFIRGNDGTKKRKKKNY